jgi:hypothetical protein
MIQRQAKRCSSHVYNTTACEDEWQTTKTGQERIKSYVQFLLLARTTGKRSTRCYIEWCKGGSSHVHCKDTANGAAPIIGNERRCQSRRGPAAAPSGPATSTLAESCWTPCRPLLIRRRSCRGAASVIALPLHTSCQVPGHWQRAAAGERAIESCKHAD